LKPNEVPSRLETFQIVFEGFEQLYFKGLALRDFVESKTLPLQQAQIELQNSHVFGLQNLLIDWLCLGN
jgi:hypothetical protein